MSAVVADRLTLKEFYREYEGRRAYLIDGVAFLMPPPNPAHADGVDWLADDLRAIAPPGCRVREEKPLETGGPNDPEPDIAVVRGQRGTYHGRHPVAADVLLVVEVSDSSLIDDRRLKLPKYAAAGISEVWSVNLRAQEVEVYRDPVDGRYAPPAKYQQGQSIKPLFAPEAEVLVDRWVGK